MVPLPGALGGSELVAWRLDRHVHAPMWDSGEGAFRCGGRWNSIGMRAVYCSLDPATAMTEVAVHTGFAHLDIVPHIMTEADIDPSRARIVWPDEVPDAGWLTPGVVSPEQQAFGDSLLRGNAIVVVPSVVSRGSWNLIFTAERASGAYGLRHQRGFALDPRLQAQVNPRRG